MSKFKVYISDYDYLDLDIEKSVLEPIGAEVIGLKCVTGKELGTLAADADAILQQYAKINRDTIEQLKNCKVICRYGTGVDILDVQAPLRTRNRHAWIGFAQTPRQARVLEPSLGRAIASVTVPAGREH